MTVFGVVIVILARVAIILVKLLAIKTIQVGRLALVTLRARSTRAG